jgi:L-histidine N-alpha-methyltransferase
MLFAPATMSGAHVFIDRSQFPGNVRRDLLESLRARAINHKFHYESHKQAAKWLALHEAYSPARRDDSCLRIYDDAYAGAIAALDATNAHLVGLGCGGGQKEARLLELLAVNKNPLAYTASDVSLPLVLIAREAAQGFVPLENSPGIVCDLATTTGFAGILDGINCNDRRLITLFGIIPNFEPVSLLSRIASLLRTNDLLLLSANLAPGSDYAAGVQRVLPQYDNELTRDWLLTLLLDLGFEQSDGEMHFTVQTDERQLRRITAEFALKRSRDIRVFGETLSFASGESIRVFFSYRHTSQTIRTLLSEQNITVIGEWLNDAGEEGVFLCRRG